MGFYETLDQILALLQRRGRVTYRALQREFNLDDSLLADLTEALLYARHPVVEEEGRGLVWMGNTVSAGAHPTTPAFTPYTPVADQERAPLSYTPPHLVEKILTSRSALEGERKQVTVLFCDLAHSTTIAARLGPEAMHTLLNRFFALALDEVHRCEGTVNQFLGDGFMALFGAPVAHEDHARRAVLACRGAPPQPRRAPRRTRGTPWGNLRGAHGPQHRLSRRRGDWRQPAHGLYGRRGYDQPGGPPAAAR